MDQTISCKKVANELIGILSKHIYPKSVRFAEQTIKPPITIAQTNTTIKAGENLQIAANNLLFHLPNEIEECIELSLPQHVYGCVVTACNISIRIIAFWDNLEPEQLLYRIDICYRA